MDVRPNPRKKSKSMAENYTNKNLTTPASIVEPVSSLDNMTVERERWQAQNNSNEYVKTKLTIGHSFIKKSCFSQGFLIIVIIFMIFIVIVLTNTTITVNDLEKHINDIQQHIANNIRLINENHNTTFKQLEEKHNTLKSQVKANSKLLSSSGCTNFKSL